MAVSFKDNNLSLKVAFKNGAFAETLKKIQGFDSADGARRAYVDFSLLYDGNLYQRIKLPVDLKVKNGMLSGKSAK